MVEYTETSSASGQVREFLLSVWGYDSFRPLQQEIVEAILSRRDVLVLMPTGGGKSLCFQLPALLLKGVTVVVSPLIALMKDQVDRLRAMGVAATYINSSLDSSEIGRRQSAVARGDVKLVYVAPERLVQPGFLALLRASHPSLFAIDEAHCISEWGHDFRPEYRELKRIRQMFPDVPVAAFTATATRRVEADIAAQLNLRDAEVYRGSFNRTNLYYDVRPKQQSFDQLLRYIREHPGDAGIVYCLSRASTEDIADRLRANRINALAYHAALPSEERAKRQEAFMRDEAQVIVATIAFGMGIDKPDVRFVAHHDMPRHLEGYYQESGRAGRDGDPADCILFYGTGDAIKLQRFIIDDMPEGTERRVAEQQLRNMMAWAEARTCRRQKLLAYFDEDVEPLDARCCDICEATLHGAVEQEGEFDEVDWTIPAQKLMSCAKRVGERFGMTHLIDILRGSKSERIIRLGHDKLSTYGIGGEWSKERWQQLGRHLVTAGYVRQDADDFHVVRCTDLGNAVLFKGEKVIGRVPRRAEHAPRSSESSPARAGISLPYSELFERLRVVRKALADERGLPPYSVFPDVALRQMTAELPTTPAALLRISGVGERRLADFGSAFIEVIKTYVDETGAQPVPVEPGPAPLFRPRRATLGQTARRTIELLQSGLTPAEVAQQRQLALSTIEGHIEEAIDVGEDVDLDRLVPPDHQAAIRSAIAEVGDALLAPIRERLGDDYGYGEIRFVRAALRTPRC